MASFAGLSFFGGGGVLGLPSFFGSDSLCSLSMACSSFTVFPMPCILKFYTKLIDLPPACKCEILSQSAEIKRGTNERFEAEEKPECNRFKYDSTGSHAVNLPKNHASQKGQRSLGGAQARVSGRHQRDDTSLRQGNRECIPIQLT
ncbi:hypothetical protein Tco_1479241, partial [Tanacetum coccineum]